MTETYPVATRVAVRRRVALRYLGGACVTCGATTGLEFDHVDPATKAFDIGDGIWRVAEVTFWLEIEKCQLLCHEHHVSKTANDRAAGTIRAGRKVKLTPAQIEEASQLHSRGWGFEALGLRYGVATSTVWRSVRKYEGSLE